MENKGQLKDDKGNTLNDITYYGHQGGINIYCKNDRIAFVFTKIDQDNNSNISKSTGMLSPAGGGRGWKDSKVLPKITAITAARMEMQFINCNPNSIITASKQNNYYENYYTTGDADHGITGIHGFKKLVYKNLWLNIDLELLIKDNHSIEYSYVVHPGSNVPDIKMKWNGTNKAESISEQGIIHFNSLGNITESTPRSFNGNNEVQIAFSHYIDNYGFKVDNYDKTKDLVIDPTLAWATYLGGKNNDLAFAVDADTSGYPYITGGAGSTTGIATSGAYQTSLAGGIGNYNAFIAKFSSSGRIQWSTYFGGSGSTTGASISTDTSGFLYIAGHTSCKSGMTTSGAFQSIFPSVSSTGYLAKFKATGILVWSTYFGGDGEINCVKADVKGNVCIAGNTNSTSGIATAGAHQASLAGYSDAFIAKFNSSGSLSWATYYGGDGPDNATGITVDASSNIYITGSTETDTGMATSGAYQTSNTGYEDAFIAKFSSTGSIVWGTFFGGWNYDQGIGISIDLKGNLYIIGSTYSNSGIATSGTYQTSFYAITTNGDQEVFLAKFSNSGSFLWGTYYCEDGFNQGWAVATDALGYVYITGNTGSTKGIASTGAYQTSSGGGSNFKPCDAFLAKFNDNGTLSWGTFYGGNGNDYGSAVVSDRHNDLYLAGFTVSSNQIATSGAYQTSFMGNAYNFDNNAFLANFRLIQDFNDAGIDSIKSPLDTICAGSQPIVVHLKNFGIKTLTSVKIGWIVNGKAQTTYSWTGSLAPKTSTNVTISNGFTFNSGIYKIVAYTSMPNGANDSVPENDTAFINIIVNPVPSASVGNPTSICPGTTTTLGSSPIGGNNYSWSSYPKGFTSTSSNPSVNPTLNTTYIITETIVATGCYKKDSQTIMMYPLPAFVPTVIKSICSGSSTIIGSNAIVGHAYSWYSVGGFSSSFSNPTVSPSQTTTYYLTEHIALTGCSQSDTAIVKVLSLPSVNAGGNKSLCMGNSLTLGIVPVVGHTYTWSSNPAGFLSTISNPIVSPNVNTTYYLTETITSTGCSSSDSAIIKINSLPNVNAGGNHTICSGNKSQIGSSAIPGDNYLWYSNPNYFSSIISNPFVSPLSTTTFYLSETNSATGCSKTDTSIITVNPLPKANTGAYQSICMGKTTTLGANSISGDSYFWTSKPVGFVDSTSNPIIFPDTTTNYFLTETIKATGCSKTNSVSVTINPLPIPKTGINETICFGTPIHFGANSTSGHIYSWNSKPSGYISNLSNPSDSPDISTIYYLTETISKTGCSKTDSVIANVNPLPVAYAGKSQAICQGFNTRLGAPSVAGHNYSWTSVPAGFNSTISNPNVIPGTTTVYNLTETITSTGCAKSNSVVIKVNQNPVPEAGVSQTICNGEQITVGYPGTSGNSYQWSRIPSGFSSSMPMDSDKPSATSTYILSEKDSLTGCIGLDSTVVVVNPNPVPVIDGADKVCGNKDTLLVYRVSSSPGSTWDWTVKNGTISSGQGTNFVTVKLNYGIDSISVKETNIFGCTGNAFKQLMLSPNPDAHFKVLGDSPIYSFKASDTIEQSYTWFFGDSTHGKQYQTTHDYPFKKDSTVKVSLMVSSSSGCSSIFDTVFNIMYFPVPIFDIQLYPNPFRNTMQVKIELEKSAHIQILVYDAIGRFITKIADAYQNIGAHYYTIDNDKVYLSNGVYFFKILVDDKAYVKGVIKD